MELLYAAAYSLAALLLLTWAGNIACRRLFDATGLNEGAGSTGDQANPRAGRVIGGLERLVIAAGVLTHRWELFAAVIALKSVARFKELNDRAFAEYFLVGSLFSILWAIFVTAAWIAYDRHLGIDLLGQARALAEAPLN